MPFTPHESTAVRRFFRDHSGQLTLHAQEVADQKYRAPNLNQFIWDLGYYVGSLKPDGLQIKQILTYQRMKDDPESMRPFYEKIISSLTIPARPVHRAAVPVEKWLRSAVFVEALDGQQIPDPKADAAQKLDIRQEDAAKAVTTHDMSDSLLNGIYLHKTEHSSSSDYGVQDRDGIYKITYFYAYGGRGLYLVGYGAHRDSGAKTEYLVQKSLTTRLHKGDVLRFH